MQSSLRLSVVSLITLLTGCTISSPSFEGRACPCLEGYVCIDDVCFATEDGGEDGATPDASGDAPRPDTPSVDGGPDAPIVDVARSDLSPPRDMGPVDSCVERETVCTDEFDNDCDGLEDCDDTDCACTERAIRVHDARMPTIVTASEESLRLNLRSPADRYADSRGSGISFTQGSDERFLAPGRAELGTGSWQAAWFNFAAIGPRGNGHMFAFPSGRRAPPDPSLNFMATNVANSAIVAADESNVVFLETTQETILVVDLMGTFSASGMGLELVDTPHRFLRRDESLLAPNTSGNVTLGEVSPSTSAGIVASVTAVQGSGTGYLRLFPDSGGQGAASHLNFEGGERASNLIAAPISGGLRVVSNQATGVIVDTVARVDASIPTRFWPTVPLVLLDTRVTEDSQDSQWSRRSAANQALDLQVGGLPGMPANVQSVVIRVTHINSGGSGNVYVYPFGTSRNLPAMAYSESSGARSVLAISALDASGRLVVEATTRGHFVVSLVGVWVLP